MGKETPQYFCTDSTRSVLIDATNGHKMSQVVFTYPRIFRALVQAICFGSKAIVDRFSSEDVDTQQVVGHWRCLRSNF